MANWRGPCFASGASARARTSARSCSRSWAKACSAASPRTRPPISRAASTCRRNSSRRARRRAPDRAGPRLTAQELARPHDAAVVRSPTEDGMHRALDPLAYHAEGRPGKIEVVPTKPVATQHDLSLAYTPGVAEPCRAIVKDPERAYDYTAKRNLAAGGPNGTRCHRPRSI